MERYLEPKDIEQYSQMNGYRKRFRANGNGNIIGAEGCRKRFIDEG